MLTVTLEHIKPVTAKAKNETIVSPVKCSKTSLPILESDKILNKFYFQIFSWQLFFAVKGRYIFANFVQNYLFLRSL